MTDNRPVAERVREALATFDAAALRPTYPPRHHRYEGRPDALLHVHLPAFALRWLRSLLAERDALKAHLQTVGDMVSGGTRLTDPMQIIPAAAELVGEAHGSRVKLTLYNQQAREIDYLAKERDALRQRVTELEAERA